MRDLSVVIPAFNQEDEIGAMVTATDQVIRQAGLDAEIIVVSDGSTDNTAAAAAAAGTRTFLRVIEYSPNRGKGQALKTGSLEASGQWIAWIDADLDLHPDQIPKFRRECIERQLDALIGSKRHPRSQVDYPLRRQLYSWMYQFLIRLLFRFNVRDTQVGLKIFRNDVLDAVLPRAVVKRYAFDVEVLAIARRLGFERISEAPITLTYQFSGSGITTRSVMQALIDTAAIAYRMYVLRWYDR